MSITDKGVKKITEKIKDIKDALYDSEVHEYFRTTIAKVKKFSNFGPKATAASTNPEEESAAGTEGSSESATTGSSAAETKGAVEDLELLLTIIKNLAEGTGEEDIDFESVLTSVAARASVTENNKENGGAAGKKKNARKQAKKVVEGASKAKTKGKTKAKKLEWSDGEEDEEDLYSEDDEDAELSDLDEIGESVPKKAAASSKRRGGPLKSISNN